jgi:hypothetical protein
LKANKITGNMPLQKLLLFLAAAIVFSLISTAGCSAEMESPSATTPNRQSPPPEVSYWQERFPEDSLVRWAQSDLNSDNRLDTMIIYSLPDGKCWMIAVVNLPDGYLLTVPAPAPVSDQQISFTDFDSRPPMEVVVTGKNGNYVGIGIFRLEQAQLVNLFADDYDKCC